MIYVIELIIFDARDLEKLTANVSLDKKQQTQIRNLFGLICQNAQLVAGSNFYLNGNKFQQISPHRLRSDGQCDQMSELTVAQHFPTIGPKSNRSDLQKSHRVFRLLLKANLSPKSYKKSPIRSHCRRLRKLDSNIFNDKVKKK